MLLVVLGKFLSHWWIFKCSFLVKFGFNCSTVQTVAALITSIFWLIYVDVCNLKPGTRCLQFTHWNFSCFETTLYFLSKTSQKLPENRPTCQHASHPPLPTILICKVNMGSQTVERDFVSFYTELCLPTIFKNMARGRKKYLKRGTEAQRKCINRKFRTVVLI